MTEPQSQPPAAEPAQKPKTDKELANEKKKAEKAARFAAKQAKAKAEGAKPAATNTPAKEKAPKTAAPALPPFEEKTPRGQKKVRYPLDDPHFSAYSPKAVESAWYEWWEASGFFKPETRRPGPSKGRFVIPLPPPNVTGRLHCGHALANSLQDTLIRWHRMRGFETLWVPGCDHAGISTQSVVEKMLWNRQKKTRMDLGREKFTQVVWEWKGEYHEHINHAQKLMGGSMDWSREAFTMDENLSAAVKETFVRLFEEGYIYRSNRLVNWCTKLNTALSTLEVENKEIPGRTMLSVPGYDKKIEFGVLTHFKYPIDGTDETIEVATTRPETMLGDTGIAVHPDDKRYAHLVGKHARHPFIEGRLLRIVADTYVDPEFGTGAVKLTPAHDFNDYNLGTTHKLDFINILNDDGTLNANAGPFAGQKRFDARYTVVEELTKLGLFVKKEPNAMKIPLCEKSKDVIEPIVKPQWWMSMKEMAADALKAVDDGRIKIVPESANKSYHRWMESVNDWCISRQLWWGHQIPAYRVVLADESEKEDDNSHWVVGKTEDEAREKAAAKFPGRKFSLERDPDCLDTWFSSGLWPFSTLGWPNTEAPDFQKFFPTSLLETGWDILFFWVARMIMFSLKLTGDVPFKEVYCHSLIRDSEGRKMSKSLGNVIDPLDIIAGIGLPELHAKLRTGNLHPDEIARAEKYQKTAFPQGIPECGADALRFTLISYATGGSDINFDIKVMAAYRRFCNKVWQASKYVLGKLPADFVPQAVKVEDLTLAEKWILHRANEASRLVNDALAAREFSRATRFAHALFYDELCDVFIENSKTILQDGTPQEQASAQNTLYVVLETSLRLLHPFMPFITEELWQRLPKKQDEVATIMLAEYPEYDPNMTFEAEAKDYELGVGCAQGIRSLAAEYAVKADGTAYVKTTTPQAHAKVGAQVAAIKTLAGKAVSSVTALGPGEEPPKGCAVVVVDAEVAVLLDVGPQIAADVEGEIKKAKGKLAKAEQGVKRQEELMSKEGWAEKVSEAVQAVEAKKLADARAARENYERTLEAFEMLRV